MPTTKNSLHIRTLWSVKRLRLLHVGEAPFRLLGTNGYHVKDFMLSSEPRI